MRTPFHKIRLAESQINTLISVLKKYIDDGNISIYMNYSQNANHQRSLRRIITILEKKWVSKI